MKHDVQITAALLAFALLLTGCGGNKSSSKEETVSGGDLHNEIEVQEVRETDISKRFPEYFKYCFGADATYTYLRTDLDRDRDVYELTYHDHTGTLRTAESIISRYDPNDSELAERWPTEELRYRADMEALVWDELNHIFRREFGKEVLEPNLEGHYLDESDRWDSDTEYIYYSCLPVFFDDGLLDYSKGDPVGRRFVEAHTEPDTGWQVCTADWTSIVCMEDICVTVTLTVSEGADTDTYSERMDRIADAFKSCSDQPESGRSGRFLVKQEYDYEHLYTKMFLFGEETDTEDDLRKEIASRLIAKYQ